MSDVMQQAAAAAPVTATVDPATMKSFTAQEIKLLFGLSNSQKSYILVDEDRLYMVNLATHKDVLDGKINKLTFRKSNKPMPKREGDPADAPDMYSWRPISVEDSKIAEYEQQAREVEAEARLSEAKVRLKKVNKELMAEA